MLHIVHYVQSSHVDGGSFPYKSVYFCISEVRLYLMILEKLEHYEKALGVLRSNLAGKYTCI